ncbi:diacylglycerol O-acyltransferase 1-like [Clytia hemisphaerica]|uniref:O-acyltransferase n=1 Tax=Clytia hemisphaerica TaxID=252671 RepID=A0A7M5WJS8_9CNID
MTLKKQKSFSTLDQQTSQERRKVGKTLSSPNLKLDAKELGDELPSKHQQQNGSIQRKKSESGNQSPTARSPRDKKMEQKTERKHYLFNKLKKVHTDQPSFLSSSSGFDNYRGIINLCLLLLILSNFRLAVDNILKYGILVDPKFVLVAMEDPYNWPCTTLFLCSNVFIQICFSIEKALSEEKLSERFGLILNIFNLAMMILVPIVVVLVFIPLPWFATMTLCFYTGLFLKFVSYVSVNKWCREEKSGKRPKDPELKPTGPVLYPKNLNQQDLYYFVCAPTFCYELNFPRTKKIRKSFLIRRIAEGVFLSGLIIALAQQWVVPTVKNSMKSFQEMDFPRFFERMMKLAVPNHVIWLIFFYTYFHSILNILAEVLHFGDRVFYKDWWNSPNITYFWQNWNIPIHRWAKRHVYEPMLRNNYSKIQASLSVFFISAFFHEYVVSVPLRMLKPYAFLAMLMQVPLAIMTSFMKNPWGNFVVWLSLIIGQPLAIMMYYHDYLVEHHNLI